MGGKWAHQPAVCRGKGKRLSLHVFPSHLQVQCFAKNLCVNSPAVNGEVYCELSSQFFGCAPSRPTRSQWTLKRLRGMELKACTIKQFTGFVYFRLLAFVCTRSYQLSLKCHAQKYSERVSHLSIHLKESRPIQIRFSFIQIPRHWRILENSSDRWKSDLWIFHQLCAERRKLLAGSMKTVNTHRHTHGSQ